MVEDNEALPQNISAAEGEQNANAGIPLNPNDQPADGVLNANADPQQDALVQQNQDQPGYQEENIAVIIPEKQDEADPNQHEEIDPNAALAAQNQNLHEQNDHQNDQPNEGEIRLPQSSSNENLNAQPQEIPRANAQQDEVPLQEKDEEFEITQAISNALSWHLEIVSVQMRTQPFDKPVEQRIRKVSEHPYKYSKLLTAQVLAQMRSMNLVLLECGIVYLNGFYLIYTRDGYWKLVLGGYNPSEDYGASFSFDLPAFNLSQVKKFT